MGENKVKQQAKKGQAGLFQGDGTVDEHQPQDGSPAHVEQDE